MLKRHRPLLPFDRTKPNMSNQDFNAVPIATPSKPGDIKDIESQSLLGADREWGSEAAMEKILRRGFLKKVRHCVIPVYIHIHVCS